MSTHKLLAAATVVTLIVASWAHVAPHLNEKGEHDANFDHEAFLGKEDAGKWDELKPAEAKSKLRQLLKSMDTSNDGMLDASELREHLETMRLRDMYTDSAHQWSEYKEIVEDDKIKWTEYKKRVYGEDDPNNPMTDYMEKMLVIDERRWKEADLDKDGALTFEEYKCAIHPTECHHMDKVVVEETMGELDVNQDGYLSEEEYISSMWRKDPNTVQEPEWVTGQRLAFNSHWDKDGNMKLDRKEVKSWVAPDGYDPSQAETDHLINMVDDDKDGKISFDEADEHYDAFVGSQATAYGSQLRRHDPAEL